MTRTLVFHLPVMLRLLGPCLAILAISWSLAPTSARAGGFYNVSECSPGHPGTPDASVQGATTDYSASTSCGSGNWLQVQSVASAPAGQAKTVVIHGAGRDSNRTLQRRLQPRRRQQPGRQPFLLLRQAIRGERSGEPLGRRSRLDDGYLRLVAAESRTVLCRGYRPLLQQGERELCPRTGSVRAPHDDVFPDGGSLPPSPPIVAGSAADGDWVSGTTQVAVGDVDSGGGVYRTTAEVNGTQAMNDVICNPSLDATAMQVRWRPVTRSNCGPSR